ncbi:MAG: cation:proton antiporter [Thermoleophilia bacterium]|nr:cation:proton antiporter [Thermoleophilia bacterium]
MDPSALTDSQVVLGITLIIAVATACQMVAPRLRVPALVLLLPAGFVLGILVPGADAQEFLGPAFGPIVDLTVAIILFQGGIELGRLGVERRDRRTASRLVWFGGPITWGAATLCGMFLLGFPTSLALLFGAIVVVSGPTVVGPILSYVKPEARLRNLLTYEGVFLDPLGALLAVILFQGIKAGQAASASDAILTFLGGLGVAVVAAAIGALLIRYGVRFVGPGRAMGSQVILGVVVLMVGLANTVTDDAGLLAALLMGLAVVRISRRFGREEQVASAQPIMSTFVTMAVGVLFVALSALVTPESLLPLLGPAIGTAAILILVVRPAMAFLMTMGSQMSWQERMFVGWMAPRGIVAAATAASIATTLVSLRIPGAEDLLPVVFTVITVTVLVYGLTAAPMAKALGVQAGDT